MEELKIKFYKIDRSDPKHDLQKLCDIKFQSSVDFILDLIGIFQSSVDFILDLIGIERDGYFISVQKDMLENFIDELKTMKSQIVLDSQHYDYVQRLLEKLNIVTKVDFNSYDVQMFVEYLGID